MKKIVLSLFAGLFVVSSVAMRSKEKKDLKNIKKLQDSEVLIFFEAVKDNVHVASKKFNFVRDNEKQRGLNEKIKYNKPVTIKPLKTVH